MTQEEAIIKAMEDLGGRASNKQVYERAQLYASFGGKTPEATIRWWLQKSRYIKPSTKGRGWWELVSYQEEIAKLKQIIKDKEFEISQLRDKYSIKECVTLDKVEAEIMECPDWATAKSRIDDINRSGILAETDWPKVQKRIQRAFKQKQEQIGNSQTEVLKEVAARPTTQNIVYPQANSTTNVGCDQKESEFKTYMPTTGGASGAIDQRNEQKRIGDGKHE